MARADNSRLFTISASREFYGVRMIKLTAAREITPYKWVHPLGAKAQRAAQTNNSVSLRLSS